MREREEGVKRWIGREGEIRERKRGGEERREEQREKKNVIQHICLISLLHFSLSPPREESVEPS